MPAKNSVKQFVTGGYYHIYNRGVEKRKIFLDDHDYKTFLYLLKLYLEPRKPKPKDLEEAKLLRRSLAKEVGLLAYCLMPNHFHLLLKQKTHNGMTKLMRTISTSYVTYFNQKYKRVGPLFQGNYKAVLLDSEEQLLHLSRYIHLNPVEVTKNFKDYPYSTFRDYTGKRAAKWIDVELILSYFSSNPLLFKNLSYGKFVESYIEEPNYGLGPLTLER